MRLYNDFELVVQGNLYFYLSPKNTRFLEENFAINRSSQVH